MTKNRRLAIKMWEGIKSKLPEWQKKSDSLPISDHVIRYKKDFCIKHNLPWVANCWFCTYIKFCRDCPLKSCEYGVYRSLADNSSPLQVKIRSCEYIISALKGETK